MNVRLKYTCLWSKIIVTKRKKNGKSKKKKINFIVIAFYFSETNDVMLFFN